MLVEGRGKVEEARSRRGGATGRRGGQKGSFYSMFKSKKEKEEEALKKERKRIIKKAREEEKEKERKIKEEANERKMRERTKTLAKKEGWYEERKPDYNASRLIEESRDIWESARKGDLSQMQHYIQQGMGIGARDKVGPSIPPPSSVRDSQ